MQSMGTEGMRSDRVELCAIQQEKVLFMQQPISDNSQNTGEDLIAFFRNSPLADVALELELERDEATSRTITF